VASDIASSTAIQWHRTSQAARISSTYMTLTWRSLESSTSSPSRAKVRSTADFSDLPQNALRFSVAPWLGCVQALCRLACVSRSVREELIDSHGRLLTGSLVTLTPSGTGTALRYVKLEELEVLHINLAEKKPCKVCKAELNSALMDLAGVLQHASSLQVLCVRLPAFDKAMERLRLDRRTWDSLLLGLGALARHGRLRSLELTYVAIKRTWAPDTGDVAEGGAVAAAWREETEVRRGSREQDNEVTFVQSAPSFVEVLAKFASLEELVLRHNEIFGDVAKELVGSLQTEALRRIDFTRNHIPRRVMNEVRQSIPAGIELVGDELQTFYY